MRRSVSAPSPRKSGRFRSPQQRSGDSSFGLDYTDAQPSVSRAAAAALSETQRTRRSSAGRSRKQKNPQRRRQDQFFEEVRALNNRTSFLIPRLPFGRLVREIVRSESRSGITHFTREALEGIQESTEMYMTQVFNDAYYLTQHRNRQTITVEDLQLLKVLKLIDY